MEKTVTPEQNRESRQPDFQVDLSKPVEINASTAERDKSSVIEVTSKDFGKFDPQAKAFLDHMGINAVRISGGPDGQIHVEAGRAKEAQLTLGDTYKDGGKEINFSKNFSADIKRGADGRFELKNIQGVNATMRDLRYLNTDMPHSDRSYKVDTARVQKTEDGSLGVSFGASYSFGGRKMGGVGSAAREMTPEFSNKVESFLNNVEALHQQQREAAQANPQAEVSDKASALGDASKPQWDVDLRSAKDVAFLNNEANKEKPLELTEKDFDKIGPKAKQVLKDFGVQKIKVSTGPNGEMHVDAEFAKEKTIKQDPSIDGTHEIKFAKNFSADITRDTNGKLTLENIKGLSAKSEGPLGGIRDATVVKMEVTKTDDGKTSVKSTGKVGYIRSSKTRELDAEVGEKAEMLFKKIKDLYDEKQKPNSKMSSLDLPQLHFV